MALDGQAGDLTIPLAGGRGFSATESRELEVEQYLFNLSEPPPDKEPAVVQPNVWLLTAEEVPPILFTPEEVARLLGIGRCRVFDLMRQRELRSVKVGSSRRISARALHDYVSHLEMGESA